MASLRPPQEFVLVPGTQFCYVPNEYDKNKYAQCNYVSQRTLMRCKQIRSKDDLASHSGICNEHEELAKHLKANFNKELHRIKAECDNSNSRRNRFESFIVSNDYVSDEDEWMQRGNTISNEFPDQIYESFIDDDPLRSAGYFTEKDVLRIKLRKYTRDLEDLRAFRDLLEAQASKINEKIETSSKSVILDLPQQRAYEASTHYGAKDYLKVSKNPRVSQGPICVYGNDKDDASAIKDIMNTIIDDIDDKIEYFIKYPCTKSAVFKSNYCIDHIILDNKQHIFSQCSICGDISVALDDPMCTIHRKEFVNIRANHPNHNIRPGDEHIKNISAEFNSDKDRVKQVVIDESDEEEKLGNLSRIESMSSPLNRKVKYSTPHIMRSSQNGKEQSAAQKVVANMIETIGADVFGGSTSSGNKHQSISTDEYMGCVRASGYCQIQKSVPSRSKVAPTPRVLPSSTTRPNFTVKPPPYQTHYRPNQKFCLQNPSNHPKQIPLERVPYSEEKNKHPVRYTRLERDAPRGVPYISHTTNSPRPYHNKAGPRSSFVTPQRHSSNKVPLPQQSIGPTKSSLPAPPHRMLAMGAKPVDIADLNKPRPSFDPVVRKQQQQQNQRDLSARPIFDPPMEQSASLATSAVPAINRSGSSNKCVRSQSAGLNPRTYTVVSQSGRYASMDASRIIGNANFANMDVKTFLEMSAANQRFQEQGEDAQYVPKQIGPLPNHPPKPPRQQEPIDSEPQESGSLDVHTVSPEIPLEKISPNESSNIVKPVLEAEEKKEEREELEKVQKETEVPPAVSDSSTEGGNIVSLPQPSITDESSEDLASSIPTVSDPTRSSLDTLTPTMKVGVDSRKRKATDPVESTEPPAKKATVTPGRVPRAAAIAANHAISHTKASNSIPASSSRKEIPTLVRLNPMNPLDVLAAVSEIEEKKERRKSIDNISPNSTVSYRSSKDSGSAKKLSPRPTPRRSTRGKGTNESETK